MLYISTAPPSRGSQGALPKTSPNFQTERQRHRRIKSSTLCSATKITKTGLAQWVQMEGNRFPLASHCEPITSLLLVIVAGLTAAVICSSCALPSVAWYSLWHSACTHLSPVHLHFSFCRCMQGIPTGLCSVAYWMYTCPPPPYPALHPYTKTLLLLVWYKHTGVR